jgi:catechol 2,3-dioxygenase-like lactoylglutathione lyase family enzyme
MVLTLGRHNHIGIATPSIERSVAMYRDLLGAAEIGGDVRPARAEGAGVLRRSAATNEWPCQPLQRQLPGLRAALSLNQLSIISAL